MNIEVNINDAVLRESIEKCSNQAFANVFRQPSYNQDGGKGYHIVENRIIDIVKTIDFSEQINASILKQSKSIVDHAVGKAIKKAVGEKIAEMKSSGELNLVP